MSNSLSIYTDNFVQIKEIATALASSDLIPPHFQKKPANVLLALEFAHRNDIAPFAAMQSMFVISGKVGMTAAMAISLARKHGVWKSLSYKVTGQGPSLSVTAIAKLHDDTEATATVTLAMAQEAGWTRNAIYKSIPEQMLRYRAATFLIRSHFPEVLSGMSTTDELYDVDAAKAPAPRDVTPKKAATVETKPKEIEATEPTAEELKDIETAHSKADTLADKLGG